MFTGIVENLGKVRQVRQRPGSTLLSLESPEPFEGLMVGDSVAVNGVCLTAVDVGEFSFSAEAVPETLRRTNLGTLFEEDTVNLERSMSLGALGGARSFGGHYVQGHVDGTVRVVHMEAEGDAVNMMFEGPAELMKYVVPKGYVALDGASLTVVNVWGCDRFDVTLVPHTRATTTLGFAHEGYVLNLEVDIMSKYAFRALSGPLRALEERVTALEAHRSDDGQD